MWAKAIRQKALDAQRDFAPPPPPVSPLLNEDVSIPDYLDAVTAAAAAERVRTDQLFALEELVRDCNQQIGGVMIAPDPLLTILATDLNELFGRVRPIAAGLDGARTPTEAITIGVADVWNELTALRQTYDEIRAAQDAVMNGDDLGRGYVQMAKSSYLTDVGFDDELTTDLALANLDDVFPTWRQSLQMGLMDRRPLDVRPWPKDDPVSRLIWLATSDAAPWIPTLAQLDELAAERRERMNPSPRQFPGIVPALINSPGDIREPVHEITT
jgi:hypothetical protein